MEARGLRSSWETLLTNSRRVVSQLPDPCQVVEGEEHPRGRWVLSQGYGRGAEELAAGVGHLLELGLARLDCPGYHHEKLVVASQLDEPPARGTRRANIQDVLRHVVHEHHLAVRADHHHAVGHRLEDADSLPRSVASS